MVWGYSSTGPNCSYYEWCSSRTLDLSFWLPVQHSYRSWHQLWISTFCQSSKETWNRQNENYHLSCSISNSVNERMNRTLLNMLAKCIDEDQTKWSVKLPYVLLAYRSSVHESTGFTPHYLVFGHEVSLPLDLMYRPPPSTTPTDVHVWVSQKEEAFRHAYELVRRNATTQQRRRNNLYNKRVHGPTYNEGEYVLLHYLVVPVGKSPKLSSPWRSPYEILNV